MGGRHARAQGKSLTVGGARACRTIVVSEQCVVVFGKLEIRSQQRLEKMLIGHLGPPTVLLGPAQ